MNEGNCHERAGSGPAGYCRICDTRFDADTANADLDCWCRTLGKDGVRLAEQAGGEAVGAVLEGGRGG